MLVRQTWVSSQKGWIQELHIIFRSEMPYSPGAPAEMGTILSRVQPTATMAGESLVGLAFGFK